jgi:virulence factor Mce-like protein
MNAHRRRRRAERSHFRAGLIAIALVCVLLFLGFEKGLPGRHHYTVDAIFQNANNLLVGSSVHPGSPVRIAGVNVGQVSSISKGPGGTAKVGLQISDAGRPLHRDAQATIRPRLFLEGNFFVDLKPGSPSVPDMPDGATIPITQTAQPVQLYQVLDTLQLDTRQDLQRDVKEFATALDNGGAQAINRSYPYAPGAFKNVALASQATLGTEPPDLSRFVASAAKVSTALAAHDQQLGDLVTTFDHDVSALASRKQELARSLSGLDALAHQAPPTLHAIDSATGPLTEFAKAARGPLEIAPPVLDASLPFLHRVAQLVAPGAVPALVNDLGPTVRSLAQLEPRLDDLFSLVAPVTSCVTTHVLPVLNAKLDDGALTSHQTVWEEFLHAATGLTSASQNFDGNGFTTRFSFGLGPDVVATGTGEQQNLAFGQYSGSRPTKPAKRPPFNPNAPCEDQALPNLSAPAHQSTARTVGHLNRAQLTELAEALLEGKRK